MSYDEPFNPKVQGLGDPQLFQKHRDSWRDLRLLMQADSRAFWKHYSAIYSIDEIRTGLSDAQKSYLRFISSVGRSILIDETRCHFKVEDLAAIHEEGAVLLHLYRSPECFATSHLIPSGQQITVTNAPPLVKQLRLVRNFARKPLRRALFWRRKTNYNNWGEEQVIGSSAESPFGAQLQAIGLNATVVFQMPAVAKLMAYWRVCFERIETDGRRYFGDRFISMPFAEFCTKPQESIHKVYALLGASPPKIDTARLHPPHGPFQPHDRRWIAYRQLLGLGDAI